MFGREVGKKVIKVGIAETASDIAYKPIGVIFTSPNFKLVQYNCL